MGLFSELKRRNVIRVAAAYAVASWLLLQVIDVVLPILKMPDWVAQLVLLLLVTGFFIALIISWAYEMTPEGLKRDAEVNPEDSIAPQTARKLDMITIGLLAAVVALVVFDRMVPGELDVTTSARIGGQVDQPLAQTTGQKPTDAMQDDTPSVAVLPFVNMSDDAQNEYFSDGISEELLNALVRIDGLRVPSRTSSFTFKGSDQNIIEIGAALNVDHVLEGSVRKAGNRIRVTAQLVEVKTDTDLWSETYTRELDDIFAVQDEIANSIVAALKLTLSGVDQQDLGDHSTNNVEAYNRFLLGRHLWNQRTAEPLLAAIKPLREAVELDPEFDQAWADLALVYMILPEYGGGATDKFIPLAVDANNKALAINPNSIRALSTSAYHKAIHQHDWEGANADFEHAIELEPGVATARHGYAIALNIQQRLDEALQQSRLARRADPLSQVVRHAPAYMNLWALRLDEAEAHYMDELELAQPTRWTMHNLDILYSLKGDFDKARYWARELAQLEGFDPAADIARIDAMEDPELRKSALVLLQQRQDIGDGVFGKALQYVLLNDLESALLSLEIEHENEGLWSSSMNYMKLFDPMRDDPRFQAMLREMNLLP